MRPHGLSDHAWVAKSRSSHQTHHPQRPQITMWLRIVGAINVTFSVMFRVAVVRLQSD